MIGRITSRVVTAAAIVSLTGCWSSELNQHPLLANTELQRLETIPVVRMEDLAMPDSTPPEMLFDVDMEELLRPITQREPQLLDLTQVRNAVLEHNLKIQVTMWNAPLAAAQVETEMGKFDALVTASITDAQEIESAGDLAHPTAIYTDDSLEFNGELAIPLLTGGTVTMGTDIARDSTKLEPSNTPPESAVWGTPGIGITQPLLRGAWTQVATAPVILEMYKDRIARAEQHLSVISVLSQAEQSYWSLAGAWENLRQQQMIYELAQLQVTDAEALFKAGQVAQTEVLRAQLGMAQQASKLVDADDTVRTAQRSLKLLLNMPNVSLEDNDLLVPSVIPVVEPFVLDDRRLVDLAMTHRMELLESELELAADTLNIEVARSGTLPDLSIALQAYRLGITENSWINSMGKAFSNQGPWGWSASLSGEIALGNHAAEGTLRQAMLTRLQDIATKHERELTIIGDVLSAVQSLQMGWKKYAAAKRAVVLAQETYAAERRLFQLLERTSTDVAEALQNVSSTRKVMITTTVDYQNAQVSLAMATGCYLGRNAVELQVPVPTAEAAVNIPGPGTDVP